MKVLLPLDITCPVKPIIDELADIVPLAKAEVLLLYVKEELPAYEHIIETTASFADDWEHQLETKAKTVFEEAKILLKPHCSHVSTEIVMGPPAYMIETVARDEKFDITAVTPGTHTYLEKFFLGSVSGQVVKHCPGTVIILRPKTKQKGQFKHVVMGIDGSKQSHHAIAQAARELKIDDEHVRITLIHAVSVAEIMKMISPVEFITMVENNLLMEGETFLADGKRLLSDQGLKRIDCVLKEGDPSLEIINLSSSLPASLVVIGAQGRTAIQHFLLGSVSERIALYSPCSTAIIKTK